MTYMLSTLFASHNTLNKSCKIVNEITVQTVNFWIPIYLSSESVNIEFTLNLINIKISIYMQVIVYVYNKIINIWFSVKELEQYNLIKQIFKKDANVPQISLYNWGLFKG